MDNINCEKCSVYKKCGGCQLQNMTYEEQLHFKEVKVIGLLGEYGHVHDISGMYYPLHYRNKVSAAFADAGGKAVSGIWQSSTGRIVKNDQCMIEDKISAEIIVTIRKLLNELKIPAVKRPSNTGFLRSVLVRRGFSTGQILVALTSVSPIFPKRNIFVSRLLDIHPEITTIVHNVNTSEAEFIYSGKEHILHGDGFITDKILGKTFKITASSFYQINALQTEKLYSKAIKLAGLTGTETVVDAYCGIGTIGLCASSKAGSVIGVETNRVSVKNAIANAKHNKINNARFFCADAAQFLSEMALEGKKCDVLFMDPTRAGSTAEFIASAAALSPRRIVYISCNPETQSRDLAVFQRYGYYTDDIYPFDMFPFTSHVETVCLLSKK